MKNRELSWPLFVELFQPIPSYGSKFLRQEMATQLRFFTHASKVLESKMETRNGENSRFEAIFESPKISEPKSAQLSAHPLRAQGGSVRTLLIGKSEGFILSLHDMNQFV